MVIVNEVLICFLILFLKYCVFLNIYIVLNYWMLCDKNNFKKYILLIDLERIFENDIIL